MPNTEPDVALQVAVGVVRGADGRVLIAERRPGTPGAGEWEFPGGKIEAGETVEQALSRELHEELGISVIHSRPLIRVGHAGPAGPVILHAREVLEHQGEAYGREGQSLDWIERGRLRCPPLLLSSRSIVHALKLPETYLFTGQEPSESDVFLSRLETALRSGVTMLRLRRPDLDDNEYHELARDALPVAHAAGAAVLLDRDAGQVEESGADGLHLNSHSLMTLDGRPIGASRWLAASCHDGGQLRQAARIGCDFAVLSPVAPTSSHPDARPLGWPAFSELAREAALPVYAMGGMSPADRCTAREHHGQGTAGISAFW